MVGNSECFPIDFPSYCYLISFLIRRWYLKLNTVNKGLDLRTKTMDTIINDNIPYKNESYFDYFFN